VLVHLNGRILPADDARVSVFDRGFIFGDGVYEGLRTVPGPGPRARVVGGRLHVQRLQQGLDRASIRCDASFLPEATADLCAANGLTDAFVYWQITRGTPAPGEPVRARYPSPGTRPTIFGYCTPLPPLASVTHPPTKKVITTRDVRWELGTLKSIALMGNVVCAIEAGDRGSDEAILIRHRGERRIVAEGLATNVVLVLPERGGVDEVVTPSLESAPMLEGVTRRLVLDTAPEIVEREVLEHELASAREVMLVGTTTYVTAVTHVDGRAVGDGTPGPWARRLLGRLLEAIRSGRDDGPGGDGRP
jgi:D-alanine transaminase